MFRRGDIVRGPFPATEGNLNVGTHYLVVLDANHVGALVMFTTSLKEATGGAYEFTQSERNRAGWAKPCRFDPNRIALFRTADLGHLRATGAKLGETSVERLIKAGTRAKATFVLFRASLRLAA